MRVGGEGRGEGKLLVARVRTAASERWRVGGGGKTEVERGVAEERRDRVMTLLISRGNCNKELESQNLFSITFF